MPGERPPTMPRDLQPCHITSGPGCPSQHSLEDHTLASRITQGMKELGKEAQAGEPREAQLRPAEDVGPESAVLRPQALCGPLEKPLGGSHAQAHTWLPCRVESSPPQTHGLNTTSLKTRSTLDKPPEGFQREDPQVPKTNAPRSRGTRARRRPSLPRAKTLPTPEEVGSQRCFQEAPSSFTSTNCTSPSAAPGPPSLRAPQSSGTSPHRPASCFDLQAGGAKPWPPTADHSFPGANYGVPSAERECFPEASRPGSPQGDSVPCPFPSDSAQQEQAAETVLFAFHQPLATWSEVALGTSPSYTPLACPSSQPGSLGVSSDLGGALTPPVATRSALSAFHDTLHKSLTKVLPEGPLPSCDELGSPRRCPNFPPQRHFSGQGYGVNGVGTSPGPLDTELPAPRPPPTHLPQLWAPSAAPYATPTLGPVAPARTVFFEGQQLCLPQSPPHPWPPVLMTPGPSPHQMGVLSGPPLPRGASEWKQGGQGSLGSGSTVSGPGEVPPTLRTSPGAGSSPGLLTYGGLKESGTQPLFFGGSQPQVSPRSIPSLPPTRVVGASPSESPLASPATNTASGSTCSSLSPLSSSPANPSPEDSQQPGSLGSSAFFLPPTHSQETRSPFPSPEPSHSVPTHYQPEPAKAFPLPADRLGTEDAFERREGAPFSRQSPRVGRDGLQGFPPEPPPYSTQHFSLSSASLDQLDVLLTCRQCDRNYSSLAAFLEHRPLCGLLLAKAKDGPPPALGLPAPSTKAPAGAPPGLLGPSHTSSFLLAREVPTDSKDDSLRTNFLPGMVTAPFPLPAPDLDMEDDAKLDRLITEALNGMEYQSDNPEIDSSFIDVFTDEEPPGPRAPSTAQSSVTQVGTAENSGQPLLPARAVAVPESRTASAGNMGCTVQNRPQTRSLGPVSPDASGLIRQHRRGKQLRLFQKELHVASGPTRGICLRPRKKGRSAERPPPRNRRTQAPRGHADPKPSLPRASSAETKSSKRRRLPSGRNPRKRRARGGSWSKELIHKIVQQKNRRYRRQVPHVPLLPAKLPGTQDSRLSGHSCASESDEDDGTQQQGPGNSSARGRFRRGRRRWLRGERKKEDLTQDSRKVMRGASGEKRRTPIPGKQCGLSQSLDTGEIPMERDSEHANHPTADPKQPSPVPTIAKSPERNHAHLGSPQNSALASESHPDTTKLRVGSGSSATCSRGNPGGPPLEPLQPSELAPVEDHPVAPLDEVLPAPDGLLGTSKCTKSPGVHTRDDPPTSHPEGCLVPVANPTDAAYTEPSVLVFKSSDLACDRDHSDRHSMGDLASRRGPPPNSNTRCELFLESKGLAGCLPEDLYSKPLAVDTLPTGSCCLGQEGGESLKPTPPKNPPYAVEMDPDRAHSPLTLESTSLFAGLAEDGFDPAFYDNLSANRATPIPLVCTSPIPRKPLTEPLYPSFLLLQEVSSVLSGLSEGKTLSKKCPSEEPAPSSPPPGPGKRNECSTAFVTNLCEDELEIKRLVTELEHQLQRRVNTQEAAAEPVDAACVGRTDPHSESPLRATSPCGGTLPAASLAGPGGSSPRREGAARSPRGQWSYPTANCTEAAPSPEAQGSGIPSTLAGGRCSSPALQEAGVCHTDDGVPLGDCQPDSSKHKEPLMHAGSSVKRSPYHKLLSPKNKDVVGTQSVDGPSLLTQDCRGHSQSPREAQGLCPGSSASPSTQPALEPDLTFPSDDVVQLNATSPAAASPSHASTKHSEGQAGSPAEAGRAWPKAERPGLESKSARVSLLPALQGCKALVHPIPDPAWVPSAHHSFCPSKVLGTGGRSLQELLPPSALSPQPRDPSVTEGAQVKGGSSGKMAAAPSKTGHLPEPKGRHPDSPSQPEKPKDQDEAKRVRLQEGDTHTELEPHCKGDREQHQGIGGLRESAEPSVSPIRPNGVCSLPTLTDAHLQVGFAERSPEKVASPHQVPQLLLNMGCVAPQERDLATCNLSNISLATPSPCGLETSPQEDPLSTSSAPGARGEPRGVPAPPTYRDPPSPQYWPACPASALLGRVNQVTASTDAEPWGTPAAPPDLMMSHWDSMATQVHCSLPEASRPEALPAVPLARISVSAPPRLDRHHPKDITERPKGSRKEKPKGSPAGTTAPPPEGLSSPKVAKEVAGLSSIPAKDRPDSGGGLGAPDPHCSEAPPLSSLQETSKAFSECDSSPPDPHGESHSVVTVSTDPATLGATSPDTRTHLESKMGISSKALGRPRTAGAKHSDTTEVQRPQGPPAGPHSTVSLSSTSSDFWPDAPQGHIAAPHHSPQKDSLGHRDPRRKPRGLKKKPEPTEKPPATCEACSASFRSGAGLSRHKARKHRPLRQASPQPRRPAPSARQPTEPGAQACRTREKKSCRVPGTKKPSHSTLGPGCTVESTPTHDSTATHNTLGPTRKESGGPGTPHTPLDQQPYTPSLTEQGKDTQVLTSKPSRPDRPEAARPHPGGAKTRGGRRGGESVDSPPERKLKKKAGKPRNRREKRGPRNSAHVTSDRHASHPSATLACHSTPLCLSPEGERGTGVQTSPCTTTQPGVPRNGADAGPGALCAEDTLAQKTLQDAHQGVEEGEQALEKPALPQVFQGPGEARPLTTGMEASQRSGRQPALDSRGTEGGSGRDGGGEGTPDPPSTPNSEAGSTVCSSLEVPSTLGNPEAQDGIQGRGDSSPEAPNSDQTDPLNLFDDEMPPSQLLPLGSRLAQKNPHVYGKRCQGPKPRPATVPSSQVVDSTPPLSAHLPTDLSDSGSLCLSQEEDPWEDGAVSLPESLLLDGLLSNQVPGLEPWTPSLSLWALEPSREGGCGEETPSPCTENQEDWSEAIPQLHMVPAAWRGLELCAPTSDTSSLGDMSPEPPNLEREPDDSGLPGTARDLEVLGTRLEIQDLCLMEPCNDLMSLPSPRFLDHIKASSDALKAPSQRTEEILRSREVRARPGKARRASYKCRVCFQRFHGLGELDLHKLAHSPSPPPTCYMCVERRFGSRELLREHLWEKHVQGKAGPWACGMCLQEVADIWMYNQHLREHAARFARHGQARRALEDLPGCLEGDSALTDFINSIMEQAARPQRGRRSFGKASGSPAEASGREGEAAKETTRESGKPKVRASATPSQDGATAPRLLLSGSPGSSSAPPKPRPTPSPDPWSHSEPLLQSLPVHEHCKDPSRDCHHCGKQFPKPFKLQRHLAVHSPQRVYLCPRCPRVYAEPRELREHLGRQHLLKEEQELPHTPLYTCELCANVMHVIRRSFVCSSCNYTFAKKDQFDRHMDKHLKSGQQPSALRGVRRPGGPGKKALVPDDTLPSKRCRVAVPSSPSAPSVDGAPSADSPAPAECCLPALPLISPESTPSLIPDQPSSQERPVDLVNYPLREDDPPPSLSPFPAVSPEGTGDCKLDGVLEKPKNEASPGSPRPCKQQPPLGAKRGPRLFSGKLGRPGSRGKCVSSCFPKDPSLSQERPVSTCHTTLEEGLGIPSQKGSTTKPEVSHSSWKHRSAAATPSGTYKLPAQPRKPMEMGTLASGVLLQSPEGRGKPNTPKAKQRPSFQGTEGAQPRIQTGVGRGQLQGERGGTSAALCCPDQQSPMLEWSLCRGLAKDSTRGPRETGDHAGPREKRRKGQTPELAKCESAGSTASDKPPRAPRKQATPSRVPPTKPKASSQSIGMRPQRKGDPGHTPEKNSPQARPPSRPYKRGRTVHSAQPIDPRDHRTAEAQSDLLSQLFGQKLTSFKIPLKKGTSQ